MNTTTHNTLKMNNMRQIIVLLVFLFSSFTASAQLTASVNKTKIGLQENFELSFKLEGNAKSFNPPPLDEFRILSGPNRSSQTSIINGRMSQSMSYSYILRPRTPGKVVIEGATAEIDGKTIEANQITVEILEKTPTKGSGNTLEENLFVKLTLDKTSAYVGEQVTATYTIYTAVNVVGYDMESTPAYTGFWLEELSDKKGIQARDEIINGKRFKAAKLHQVALFPQKSGKLEVPALDLQVTVRQEARRRQQSIFDDFFGGYADKQYFISSNKGILNIKSLPASGMPANFTGLVGKFNLKSSIDKTSAQANDGITLKFHISGSGNVNVLNPQELNLPPDIEVYEPKVKTSTGKSGTTITGSKRFDYLLIPRRGGQFPIPSQSFTYFDPAREKYVTLTSPEYELNISGSTNEPVVSARGLDKEEVALLGEDIRYIKTKPGTIRESGKRFYGSWQHWAGLGAPVLLFLGLIAYRKKEEGLSDQEKKLAKAGKVGLKRLKSAKEALDKENLAEFYHETGTAIEGYLVDRFGLSKSNFTRESATETLVKNGFDTHAEQMEKLLASCDMARYAPGALNNTQANNDYQLALNLIKQLETKS